MPEILKKIKLRSEPPERELPEEVRNLLLEFGITEKLLQKTVEYYRRVLAKREELYYKFTEGKGEYWWDRTTDGRSYIKFVRSYAEKMGVDWVIAEAYGKQWYMAMLNTKPSDWQDAMDMLAACKWALGVAGIDLNLQQWKRLLKALGISVEL